MVFGIQPAFNKACSVQKKMYNCLKPVVSHELESPFHAAGTSSSDKTGPNDSSNKMLRCTEGSLTSYRVIKEDCKL